jgi:hypothetical protein
METQRGIALLFNFDARWEVRGWGVVNATEMAWGRYPLRRTLGAFDACVVPVHHIKLLSLGTPFDTTKSTRLQCACLIIQHCYPRSLPPSHGISFPLTHLRYTVRCQFNEDFLSDQPCLCSAPPVHTPSWLILKKRVVHKGLSWGV